MRNHFMINQTPPAPAVLFRPWNQVGEHRVYRADGTYWVKLVKIQCPRCDHVRWVTFDHWHVFGGPECSGCKSRKRFEREQRSAYCN